jgi:hypothetical protein
MTKSRIEFMLLSWVALAAIQVIFGVGLGPYFRELFEMPVFEGHYLKIHYMFFFAVGGVLVTQTVALLGFAFVVKALTGRSLAEWWASAWRRLRS